MDIAAILSKMGAVEGAQTQAKAPEVSGAFAAILAMLGEAHRVTDATLGAQAVGAAPAVAPERAPANESASLSGVATAAAEVVDDYVLLELEAKPGVDVLGDKEVPADVPSGVVPVAETPPVVSADVDAAELPADVDAEERPASDQVAGSKVSSTQTAPVSAPAVAANSASIGAGDGTSARPQAGTDVVSSTQAAVPETAAPVRAPRAPSVPTAPATAREAQSAPPARAEAVGVDPAPVVSVDAPRDVAAAPKAAAPAPGTVTFEPEATTIRISATRGGATPEADTTPNADTEMPVESARASNGNPLGRTTVETVAAKPVATVAAAPVPPVDGDAVVERAVAPPVPAPSDAEAIQTESDNAPEPEARTPTASVPRSEVAVEFAAIPRSQVRLVQRPAPAAAASDNAQATQPAPGVVAAADEAEVDVPTRVRADTAKSETVAKASESKSEASAVSNARQWASDLHAAVIRRAAHVAAPEAADGPPKTTAPRPSSDVGSVVEAKVPEAPVTDVDTAFSDSDDALGSSEQRRTTNALPTAAQDGVRRATAEADLSKKVEAVVRSDGAASVQAPVSPAARVAAPTAPVQVIEQSTPVDLGEFVVRHVRVSSSDGTQTWTVRLVPESLGELRVEVSSQDSHVTVRLVTPNGDVRDRLEGQLHRLHEALVREGVEVTRVVVASQSSAGPQLMTGDTGGHAGRGQQAPQPGSSGQPAQQERGWNGQGESGSRDGHQPPRRPRSALDLWA